MPTAQQWETALTRHYLRSDGPLGASPLSYIDATPEQLAVAIGRARSDADEVLRHFLTLFDDRGMVLQALRRGSPKPLGDCEGPGWLRYLILTCVVAAASTDVVAVNDYRERLQSVLRWNSRLLDLSGIATLWQRLASWSEQKRLEGEPYRAIALPDPGGWRQIGYSLRVSFPSRSDRRRLATLCTNRDEVLSPRALVALIRGRLGIDGWSHAFRAVFLDFEDRYRKGDRLIADHAFWRLAHEMPGSRGIDPSDSGLRPRLRLLTGIDQEILLEFEIDASAVPEDSSEITIQNDRATLSGSIEEVFEQILTLPFKQLAGLLRLRGDIEKGIVPFVEMTWGTWDWSPKPELCSVRVLVGDIARTAVPHDINWHPVAPGWQISSALSSSRFETVFRPVRLEARSEGLRSVEVHGGIRTAGHYLGLPSLFPSITAVPGCKVQLDPIRVEFGNITAQVDEQGVVRFFSSEPVAGVWKLSIVEHEGSSPTELIFRFVDRAIEHVALGELKSNDWPQDADVKCGPLVHVPIVRLLPDKFAPPSDRLLNLLEAIYSAGRSPWTESDLIPLIQTLSGTGGPSPWDILRAIQEGGFLVPQVAVRWRARRWCLNPPRLLSVGTFAVLDGAVPRTLRERFLNIASAKGGAAFVRNGVGPWSIPVLVAQGVDIDELAADLDIPLRSPLLHAFARSPGCWQPSIYDTQFREAASTWDWNRGHFITGTTEQAGINLQRWSRAKRDAPDIYTLTNTVATVATLANRTAAVMEAHRLKRRPLFKPTGHILRRTAVVGWLPDQAAMRLRLSHLASSGPIADPTNKHAYGYPCDAASCGWLSLQFGESITGSTRQLSSLDLALARRTSRYRRFLQAQFARGVSR